MKKIVVLAVLILCLVGCDESKPGRYSSSPADVQTLEDYKELDLVSSNKRDYGYSYLVDKNTGVVYLEYSGYRTYGITVMFNADGTVMTEDDIKNTEEHIDD